MPKFFHRGFDSYALLIGWSLWKERNARTFQARATNTQRLALTIKDEADRWCEAGNAHLARLLARISVVFCSRWQFVATCSALSLDPVEIGLVTCLLPSNLYFELSSV